MRRHFFRVRCFPSDVFWDKGPVIQQSLAPCLHHLFLLQALKRNVPSYWCHLGFFSSVQVMPGRSDVRPVFYFLIYLALHFFFFLIS